MHDPNHPCLRNRILALLPENEFELFRDCLEPINLPKGQVIAGANGVFENVYFLCSGIGSVVTASTDGHRAEAGMVGREGFCPTSAGVGGTISIHEVVMQVAGDGYRMSLEAITRKLPRTPVFANLLARFIQAFSAQISFTALCNANYQMDQRLARWLLMCHDRLEGNEISLTHGVIASMLAVRRPSITNALHVLEGKKLVVTERGRITIRDRKGLEEFAGGAYGGPEEEYRRLIGSY